MDFPILTAAHSGILVFSRPSKRKLQRIRLGSYLYRMEPREFLESSDVYAALYFGVERLLSKCKSWLSVLASSNDPASPELELSDLIPIWRFGLKHAGEFVPDLCAAYLAKNFMLVKSDKYFGRVPYELLMCCIKHPHLAVQCEMHLADALFVWLDANRRMSGFLESSQDNTINLMEQVRFTLLPLWFIAGRSKSHGFSNFVDQNIDLVIKRMKMPSTYLVDSLTDAPPADLRVRLTEYTEILDLSGCLQLNEVSLLLSVLPNSYFANLRWKKSLKSFLKNPDERHREHLSNRNLPSLSFKSVKEIDISLLSFRQSKIHYFVLSMVLAYLLMSASTAAVTRVEDWVSNWGKDEFTEMASASIAMSFLAFLAFAFNSLISV